MAAPTSSSKTKTDLPSPQHSQPSLSALPRKRSPSPSPLSPRPSRTHSSAVAAPAVATADSDSAASTDEHGHGHGPIDRMEIRRRLVRAKKLRKPLYTDDDNDDTGGDDGSGSITPALTPAAHATNVQAQPHSKPGPSSASALASARRPTPHEHALLSSRNVQGDVQESSQGRGHEREQSRDLDQSQKQNEEDHATTTAATGSPSQRNPSTPPPPAAASMTATASAALTQGGFPRSEYAPSRDKHPGLHGCRSVYNYTRLNHIEEGTYGVVFRARCNDTQRVYALKKLKLDDERHGFPITSLREINALMTAGDHENVVGVREVVVGDTLNQIFIVMPFVEHDLKTLLADMPHPFVQSEVKTIMLQLLSAVEYCHANWILHRDLKTSNLLMTNRGQIKVADFGLARKFGDPLGEMTQLVVTLWYRSPELLLGAKEYTTAVDMWSVGCIFAELLQKEPLFPGRGEIDQLNRIFTLLGRPNEDAWPGWTRLPNARSINAVGPGFSQLRQKFKHLSSEGHYLLSSLLCYDPERRISAAEAGKHAYFSEQPLPKHPDLFPSFPSVASGERRHKLLHSPPAPAHEQVDSEKMDLESFV